METRVVKSDREIHHAVIKELAWNSEVSETDVGVSVDHGVVTLTGTVANYAIKLAAQRAAST